MEIGRSPPTRCDSGADSIVWMREESGEDRPYFRIGKWAEVPLPPWSEFALGGLRAFKEDFPNEQP